jgi:hypothetical protein
MTLPLVLKSGKLKNMGSTLAQTLPLGSKARSKLSESFSPRITHGGLASLKKRKTPRPFSPEAPLHLVLSSERARGIWSLNHRKNKARVSSMIFVYAKRFKVKVYRIRNEGRELHLLVKAKERKHLADYLRVLAGRIAVTISGAQKYVKRIGKFWDSLYYSTLIRWGAEFYQVRQRLMSRESCRSPSESLVPKLSPEQEPGPPT